jgi:hypothetical protein
MRGVERNGETLRSCDTATLRHCDTATLRHCDTVELLLWAGYKNEFYGMYVDVALE